MNDAKIIAITQPLMKTTVEQTKFCKATGRNHTSSYQKDMSVEEFIAYTARVSNPSNQHNTLTAPKLLKYLIEHKHWSPFEMVSITMEINTTRDISHQIIRHRSFSFQEFSQRYADPTKDMQFVTREARLQDAKNRQNSIEVQDFDLQNKWETQQAWVIDRAKSVYQWAIENGIAKEQARAILPEGLTTTRLYMAGTLRSWIHYIDVRAEEGTQKEHRQVALAAQEEILKHFPSLKEYWFPKSIHLQHMERLGKEFEKVLYDNLDDLYVTDEKPKSWWKFW
jgi:thymidylate synthase (FAD)